MHVLNKFWLGCDPEFVVLEGRRAREIEREYGHLFPPNRGIGFEVAGCGRVLELRPRPSRVALLLVERIRRQLHALQGFLPPGHRKFAWRSGGHYLHFPLGGHIHFGWPKSTCPSSSAFLASHLQALALVTRTLYRANVLSQRQATRRLALGYGDLFNHRPQDYYFRPCKPVAKLPPLWGRGWEYRSLNSWLESPQQAHVCLAVCKLALVKPPFTQEFFAYSGETRFSALELLRSFFKFYRNQDSDAESAHETLKTPVRTWAGHRATDFKVAWGIK